MSSSFTTIRAALGLAALLGGLGLCGGADAQQSRLPACQSDETVRRHNCYGTRTYADHGGKYSGEYRNNQPHGQGTVVYPDGTEYLGAFRGGKRNGSGTNLYPDGSKYVGEYKDGQRNGQGTYTWPDGRKYVGEWRNDQSNGLGTLYSSDGSALQIGIWESNKFIKSADVNSNSAAQAGLSMAEQKSAAGSSLPNCPAGIGTVRNNCVATQILADGRKYVGEWKNGKRVGSGVFTWPNGNKYVGEFQDDKINGKGTFTLADGRKFVGQFKDEKMNGRGTYTWPSGQEYVGEFKDDKRHGDGTNKFPHGGKYVGQFKDDKENGQGTLYSSTGTVLITGRWANGEFTGEGKISPSEPNTTTPTPSVASVGPSPALPKNSSGSAFRIAEGMFITNQHVIDACKTIKIGGTSGGKLVASDQARDLALVSIANDNGDIASVRTTRIQLNESITVAGFPLEGSFSGIAITNGTISRLTGLNGDINRLQISAPVQPGNSGGPLLDTAGNVIGVVSSKLNALKVAGTSGDIPQNVNFAITGNALRSFLDSKSFNYKEIGNERELTGVQIASRASGFTVLIECQR